MRRIYRSDNDEATLYVAALRARTGRKVSGADVWRGIIRENRRLRQRERWQDGEVARLLRERREAVEKLKAYEKRIQFAGA
jgi:hypothetical protein